MADRALDEADWAAIGIGLGYDEIRFGRTTQEWLDAGTALADRVRDELAGLVTGVEAVGSSSVLGLLAKPIIDLAVGLPAGPAAARVGRREVDHVYVVNPAMQGMYASGSRVRLGKQGSPRMARPCTASRGSCTSGGVAAERSADPPQAIQPVTARLEAAGWIYRGDAGDDGGHVFVRESRPWFRVAHLHVVAYDGTQWRNYLQFRELLRRSPEARERYEAIKRELVELDASDRKAYTSGKSDVVTALLRDA